MPALSVPSLKAEPVWVGLSSGVADEREEWGMGIVGDLRAAPQHLLAG